MRVLLINPPIEDFYITRQRLYPLNLLYIGTLLKLADFKVEIINSLEYCKKTQLSIPKDFSYLKRYYHKNKSPFCLFSDYYRFGLDFLEIEERIKKFSPDIVGISSNFSCYYETTFKVAEIVKKINKNIIVIVGGRFATTRPKFFLKNSYIDFVIRGEAEFSFFDFCRGLSFSKIKGLCYRKDNRFFIKEPVFIEDLNSIPIIDRRLIDYTKYKFKKDISTSIITSRGCIFGCKFCGIRERFRYRKAENVFKEIEDCFSLGIRHFNFEDDNINLNLEFEKLLDILIENFSKKIKISFMNGLLPINLNKSLQDKLIKCNLTHIDFSLASVNEKYYKRIFSISNKFAKYNIPSTVHFIVGMPEQSIKDLIFTIKLLSKERVFLGPSIFYPVIESPLFNRIKKYTKENYKFFRSSCAYFDKDIKRDDIFLVFYISRIINFIKKILDKFNLDNNNFYGLLNKIEEDKNKDKDYLGMILLKKILKENKIFRIDSSKFIEIDSSKFIEEEFINKKLLQQILNNLKIYSLFNYIKLRGW